MLAQVARLTRRSCAIGAAAIALLLVAAGAARAAAPTCDAVPAQTIPFANQLFLSGGDYCIDTDSDQLTYSVVALPAHGNLDATPDGFFTYTPDDGYSGDDSFKFTAKDATATTAPVTVAITVAADRAPDCRPTMSFNAEPGQSTSFDPLFSFDPSGGCSDPDFQALTAVAVEQPAHGSLTDYDAGAGGFTYTPDTGYSGPDAFMFTASDGTLDSGLVHVAITVLKPNHAPHCVTPVTVRTPPNTPVSLTGSSSPCSDPDGDQFTPNLVSGPSHGELTILGGVVVYMPARGFLGTDRIVYQVVDTRGAASNDATLNLVVGPIATPTPTPRPTPRPASDTTPPSVGVRIGRQRLAALRRHGLRIVLKPSEPCTLRVNVFVDRRTARKLRLVRRPTGPVRVGAAIRHAGAERVVQTIPLKSKLRNALRSVNSISLRVHVIATDAAGNARARERTLVVRR
jgi:hypothetical protein